MKQISEVYRNRRITLGLTQDQAARIAGLSRRTLVDFETGGERISMGNLKRLLSAVGLDIATREFASRPTLDELSERYDGSESTAIRKRARPKRRMS